MNQSPKQWNTRYSENIRSIDDNSKEFVFLHTCEGGIIYRNVYIWEVNLLTMWLKNDKFGLVRMDSEFVSILFTKTVEH